MQRLLDAVRRPLAAFGRDRQGNVAVIFTFAVLPLVAFVGAARQASTCANVKAAGIILYTIQVETDGEATSKLLQNCANSLDKFYLLRSAGQIVTTFESIATNLTQLRIA